MVDALFDLTGKVAVVTGAARGLGRAAARSLGGHGATVILADRDEDELGRTTQELGAQGLSVMSTRCDVTDDADITNLVTTVAPLGSADIVVNCAGVIRRMDIADLTPTELELMWAVNVRGTVAVTQAFLPQVRAADHGKIINVGSLGSVTGLEKRTGYAATKGGVAQYTVSLAAEVGVDQVCVNAIAPGYVRTSMTGEWLDDDDRRGRLLDRIPMGRFAEPADLDGVFVFLAAPASNYVTGQVLLVDGGWTTT